MTDGATSGSSGHLEPTDVDARTHLVVPASTLDEQAGERFALSVDAHHHCSRVLRLRPNDPITLTDGAGRWVAAVLAPTFATSGDVIRVGSVVCTAAPRELGVAFALTKGDKPETVVQKLTELGIRRIIPIRSTRSVVVWDEARAERNIGRLTLIARAALEQSRGVWLPVIEHPIGVEALAKRTGVVRAERGGRALRTGDAIVAIGPEGGWDAMERELLSDAVGLPGSVLRAETAAVVAAAMLVGRSVAASVVSG